MGVVGQIEDDSWMVVCAASCYMAWYLPLCSYIFSLFCISSLHHFRANVFNLASINGRRHRYMCFFVLVFLNKDNIEGNNSSKISVWWFVWRMYQTYQTTCTRNGLSRVLMHTPDDIHTTDTWQLGVNSVKRSEEEEIKMQRLLPELKFDIQISRT